MKIGFISDFFENELLGGAELNDSVLIESLKQNFELTKIKTVDFHKFDHTKCDYYIISNFVGLKINDKKVLLNKRYSIYEHDHKYVSTRNPAVFPQSDIPTANIINLKLYENADRVFVLSQICKDILEKNLNLKNVYNIGCSLWPDETFEYLNSLSKNTKEVQYGIMSSSNQIKGTNKAIEWCKKNNISYKLFANESKEKFLEELSKIEKIIFFPQVLETFSRYVAEASMLNCGVITQPKKIGLYSEEGLKSLKGDDLNKVLRQRKSNALREFSNVMVDTSSRENKKKILFIGKFQKLHDEEGKALALERVGFEVIRAEEDKFNHNNECYRLLIKHKPDYVFYTKLRIPGAQKFMNFCHLNQIITCCWVPDLYFSLPREHEVQEKIPMFQGDFVFTPDGGNNEKFNKLGINHYCVHQAIPEESCRELARDIRKEIDILFVGTVAPPIHGESRKRLIEHLAEKYGNKFAWAGHSSRPQVRGNELTLIIQKSKIVIGDCVASPYYWSNRVYETIGRSGFLLHPYVEGIREEFPDSGMAYYERDNFEDLDNKIEYYLKNPAERNKIVSAGFEYVTKNHTLDNRASNIKKIISDLTRLR